MSFDALSDLNWLGVLVATFAYFIWGALWYSPVLFGKIWATASGFDQEDMEEGPGPAVFAVPFLFSFVATIATGMLAEATATDTLSEGLTLGLIIGVGYGLTIVGVTAMFESKKPNALVWGLITAGYHMVGLVSSAVIVSVLD